MRKHQEYLMELYGEDIYREFPIDLFELDVHGWRYGYYIFEDLISKIKPKVIIELGTWCGASAIWMAEICKKKNIDATIFCVDTWLGNGVFLNSDDEAKLNRVHGLPSIYYQFLANVILEKHQDVIVPIVNTTSASYRILDKLGIRADLIFVDASHQEEDVYLDMKNYFSLLQREGSVMFGDDIFHIEVRNAVTRFCIDFGMSYITHDDTFWEVVRDAPDPDSDQK